MPNEHASSDRMRDLILAAKAYEIARSTELDPVLVWSVVMQESSGHPWAYRYEPRWRWFTDIDGKALHVTRGEAKAILSPTEFHAQSASWGPMQVMGSVAREIGYHDQPLSKLIFQPNTALYLGCKKLSSLWKKFAGSEDDAISAYNDGDDYTGHDNYEYVDGVKSHRAAILRDRELLHVLRTGETPPASCIV